jgi:hypothetical protein
MERRERSVISDVKTPTFREKRFVSYEINKKGEEPA